MQFVIQIMVIIICVDYEKVPFNELIGVTVIFVKLFFGQGIGYYDVRKQYAIEYDHEHPHHPYDIHLISSTIIGGNQTASLLLRSGWGSWYSDRFRVIE